MPWIRGLEGENVDAIGIEPVHSAVDSGGLSGLPAHGLWPAMLQVAGKARPRASMTAWVRERTPSLRRITVTWAFTVGSPTPSL